MNIPELNSVDLSVRVMDERNQPVAMSSVQLLSGTGVHTLEMVTNDVGQAYFGRVPVGSYRLRVVGPGIKEGSGTSFVLFRGEGSHVEAVQVERDFGHSRQALAGIVASSELNVPREARKQFESGLDALYRNDLNDAEKRFTAAVSLYPRYVSALNNLGVVFVRKGNPGKAQEAFERALGLDQRSPVALFNLSKLLHAAKKDPDAEALLDQLLILEPLNAEAWLLLARSRFRQGKLDLALANARKVHSLPHDRCTLAHVIAGQVLESNNLWEEALVEYQTYLKESPQGSHAQQVREGVEVLQRAIAKSARVH
ncbi:MAG: tetratricopeptide repeat protein [Terriglobales bacterium]